MAERTRFAARSSNAFPIIGIGLLAAVVLPLLAGGWWFIAGPMLGALAVYVAVSRPKGTIVIVDKQGLLDRRLGTAIVPWRHISGVDRVVVIGIVYINAHLTTAGATVVEFPLVRRLTNPLRNMMGIAPVHITASGLDATPDEVLSSVRTAFASAGIDEPRARTTPITPHRPTPRRT